MNGSESKNSEPCGLPRRLAAMVYDSLVVIALLMLAALLPLLVGIEGRTAGKDPLFTFYLVLVWFFYLAGCWRRGGMTLGMRAWRIRLVSRDGSLPCWKQCSIRFLVSIVSAAALGAGFLWALIDPHKRGWHDLASKTRLLRIPKQL